MINISEKIVEKNQQKPFIVNNVTQIVPFIGLRGKMWSIRTDNR